MKKLLSLFLLLHCITIIPAQSFRYPLAIPYIGATAYSTQQSDAFSFYNNQAALTNLKQTAIGVFAERRFVLADLNNYNAAIVVPSHLGNFGLQLNYAGFTNFTENKIGLAYAKALSPKLSAGVQFNYYGYKVPAHLGASTVSAEVAMLYNFTEKLNGGIQITNPIGGNLLNKNGTYNLAQEKLPAVYSMGLGYDASENFYTHLNISKEEDKPINVTGGFQYHFAKQFFARAGFISESGIAYAGAGVGFQNFRIDVSSSYHQQLGVSPGILFIANLGKK